MEKKRVDVTLQVPAPVRVDRFGFVKPEHISPDRLAKSKSAFEHQR